MSDLTPETLAELRRLAEACPMPDNDPDTLSEWYELEDLTERNYPIPPIDAAFIAAASPDVVLALLDRLAHMTEARDNARAEVDRLSALVEAVREDARDIARDSGDDKGCYGVDFWAGMCKAAARIDGRIRHALDGAES